MTARAAKGAQIIPKHRGGGGHGKGGRSENSKVEPPESLANTYFSSRTSPTSGRLLTPPSPRPSFVSSDSYGCVSMIDFTVAQHPEEG